MAMERVRVIGGGLAGCEAAWRLARTGVGVDLYEMKPVKFSPAHTSELLAELVCSNSLRSNEIESAVGLLKEEMRRLGSLVMEAADICRVPAGKALAVDRERFAASVTSRVEALAEVRLIREEVTTLDPERLTVLAAGPLVSEPLAEALAGLIGAGHLHFYDAISPIVTAESIDMTRAFIQSRYDETGQGDYLNCPMSEPEYANFIEALGEADRVEVRPFEEARYFEGCLPIEVMAERGADTLRFGPMKPVGLTDPTTGQRPHAVVQLRRENAAGTLYNLVGFQTRMKRPAQDRVLRLIPALAQAEFARYGSIHRNTFIHGPKHLNARLQLIEAPRVLLAGQISGVEGYVESAAMGILAGENAARLASDRGLVTPPPTTAHGALVAHLTDPTPRNFQPANVNFGLFAPAPGVPKKQRKAFMAQRALSDLTAWMGELAEN